MYPRSANPELSQVDFEAWRGHGVTPEETEHERARHPHFEAATLYSVTLQPGDLLYTPPFWWHHVETAMGGHGGGAAGAVEMGEAALSVLVPFDQSAEEKRHTHICHGRSL